MVIFRPTNPANQFCRGCVRLEQEYIEGGRLKYELLFRDLFLLIKVEFPRCKALFRMSIARLNVLVDRRDPLVTFLH